MGKMLDKDVEFEDTLPHAYQEITKIISADMRCLVKSTTLTGKLCTINGEAVCSLIYLDEVEKKLMGHSFVREFTQSIEINAPEGAQAYPEAFVSYRSMECKAIDRRKVLFKATLMLTVEAYVDKSVLSLDTTEGGATFFKTEEMPCSRESVLYDDVVAFEEDLQLLRNEPPILDIIRGKMRLKPAQYFFSDSRAEINAQAAVSVLYNPEDDSSGRIRALQTSIPVNISIEQDDFHENGVYSVELELVEASFTDELDTYGDKRLVRVAYSVRVVIKKTETLTHALPVDLFTAGYVDKTESMVIKQRTKHSQLERTFNVDGLMTPQYPLTGQVLEGDVVLGSVRASVCEGGVCLKGNYTYSILGYTADSLESYDFQGTFDEIILTELPENTCDVEAKLCPFEFSATIMPDGAVSLRVAFSARINVITEEKHPIICDIIEQHPIAKEKEINAMLYYFPDSRETLWNIAKKYSVNPAQIKEANPEAFDEAEQLRNNIKMILVKK